MQEHAEGVTARYFVQNIHEQGVVVHSYVGLFEDGRKFKLTWGHFVVARLDGYAQFVALVFHFAHVAHDALGDATEVVVVHLLAFGGRVSEERSARHNQVRACVEQSFVDQEVLLLPS